MGLKKTNYEVKKFGITLPEAYAFIHRLEVNGDEGAAEFYVQASPRKSAMEFEPYERIVVRFNYDRQTNPYELAYSAAKTVPAVSEETKIKISAPFEGWEDDIVQEK